MLPLAAPGILRDTEEGQAPLFAGGTFQSRGSRWLPRVFVPVLLAQRSKKTQEKNQKKAPSQQLSEAPDLLDLQVPVTLSLTATHHKSPTPRWQHELARTSSQKPDGHL